MRIEKTEITNFPVAYRVIIEDIVITDEKDIAKCKEYEAENQHTSVRCMACKYATSSLFIDAVTKLVSMESAIKQHDEDERQALLWFLGEHFRITFFAGPTEGQRQALSLYNEYKDRYHYPLVELEKNLMLWLKDRHKVNELLDYVKDNQSKILL